MSLVTPKFNRRQSYDPSTTKINNSLSLGPLPLPNFTEFPAGQRSVPINTNNNNNSNNLIPRLSSGGIANHRNVYGPSSSPSANLNEAPRTPGGSLVIGSEVFGFGKHSSNNTTLLGKERWGNGTIEVDNNLDEGVDQQTPKGETDPIKWPSNYNNSNNNIEGGVNNVNNNNQYSNDFNSNQEFKTNFSRPQLSSFGSFNDVKSNLHPSLQRPTVSRTQSSIPLQTPASTSPTSIHSSAIGLDLDPISPSSVGVGANSSGTAGSFTGVYPQSSNIDPNSIQAYGDRNQPYDASGFDFVQQTTADDLAFGLGNFNLGNEVGYRNYSNNNNNNGRRNSRHNNNNNQNNNNNHYNNNRNDFQNTSFSSRDSISMSRQTSESSAHYNPYYYPQVAPFNLLPHQISHDPYTGLPFVVDPSSGVIPPPAFFPSDLAIVNSNGLVSIGGVSGLSGVNTRRDSGYASSSTLYDSRTSPHLLRRPSFSLSQHSNPNNWNVNNQQHQQQQQQHVVPPIAMSDYTPSSSQNSRHGSFSFSPAMSQQSLVSYNSSPSGGNVQNLGTSGLNNNNNNNNNNSQYNNLPSIGRNNRNDYIAPGPSIYDQSASQFNSNYGNYGRGSELNDGGRERYSDDLVRVVRSPILEEFRISRHRSWELSDIAGHVVEFSGDQLGSRHIQTKLESATLDEKELVFSEILPNLLQLSTDVFANYVIQKFFEQGSLSQKTAMAKVLEGHVLELSLQMYGCRVVQKALEYVLLEQQVRLIKELDGHVLKCSRDAQSNHVVQRALERVPSRELTFITDACIGQVHSLATHPYGCRVLQRIFENCHPSQTKVLLEELHLYTQTLIQDQYGNYVIQWIVERGEQEQRSLVISKIQGQVLTLAQQKFASNVIEKCIIHATDQERFDLIEEVLTPASDGSSVVKAMLVHQFANYVMQKILHTAVGNQREEVFNQTSVQLTNLRKYASSYSKHLIAIEKLLTTERARTF